jgi:YidC/Oxa1 family membrane protein insertase
MEKNTFLAIMLSMVVLIGFFFIQGIFFPPEAAAPPRAVEQSAPVQPAPQPSGVPAAPVSQVQVPAFDSAPEDGPEFVQHETINTGLMTVVLTNAGGDIVSWRLNEHYDNEDFVEMVLSGSGEAQAFSIAFGGLDVRPVTSLFHVNRISDYSVEFYRDFVIPSNSGEAHFRMTKRYDFKPGEYMFELTVTLDSGFSMPGFNFGGYAYTLIFGPQIGPKFEKLNRWDDYRENVIYFNGKRKVLKQNETIDSRPAWAAISGKYFSLIAIPYLSQYTINFSDRPEAGLNNASRLNIIRPAVNSPRITDTFRFYLGPKNLDLLANYNNGRNEFGLVNAQLIDVASSRGVLAPLEKVLKWLLQFFYGIVPNYGIAIILVTLVVKIVFFPLTKKGSEATLRMQALSPKIKELQEKYKGNPQKLNAEMGAFYKQEGYNPVSGCLPMLLQIPIFIAMYNLFNNHFDLRGAMFIPYWIADLSVPETIWNFPGNFRLPLLGWTALRGLPFIYVGSQLLYGKVTQTPTQMGNTQMKMMLYVMPIVFFFILYDVPSGLLLYWIFSNVLTLVQQVIINKFMLKKRAAANVANAVNTVSTAKTGKANSKPVIAPPKKKKK